LKCDLSAQICVRLQLIQHIALQAGRLASAVVTPQAKFIISGLARQTRLH
jgi:hypothetical protein